MENWDKFSGVEKRKEIYIPNIFQIWCCWPQWMTEGMFFTLGQTKYLAGKTSGLRPNTETEAECTIYLKIRGDFAYLANSLIFSLFDCAKKLPYGSFFLWILIGFSMYNFWSEIICLIICFWRCRRHFFWKIQKFDIQPYWAFKFSGRNRRPKGENVRFRPKFLFSTPENLSQFSIVPLKCCAWKNWKK